MCSSNDYQGSGLTKGQFLLSQIKVTDAIRNEVLKIKGYGFIPTGVVLSDFLYQRLKREFCSVSEISSDAIEVKKLDDLQISAVGQERSFNIGGVLILPIQISYALPVDEAVEGDTSGEDENFEPMDQNLSREELHERLDSFIRRHSEEEVSVHTLVYNYRNMSSDSLQDAWAQIYGTTAAKFFVRHFGLTAK